MRGPQKERSPKQLEKLIFASAALGACGRTNSQSVADIASFPRRFHALALTIQIALSS
jgi:hypothetical protein